MFARLELTSDLLFARTIRVFIVGTKDIVSRGMNSSMLLRRQSVSHLVFSHTHIHHDISHHQNPHPYSLPNIIIMKAFRTYSLVELPHHYQSINQ